ncbi:MAG: hypothetical protein ACHQIM_06285 [Sphingobacteriales bacterium]
MKKITAIFLLFILLFDICGYMALRQYMVYRADRFFNQQTAKNLYNKDDLVEVQIPVNLPGMHDWSGYEHISGQIRFQDMSYNYVQMKITSHILYLKCVPDYETTQLTAQNIINATPIKNMPVPKKDHVPFVRAQFLNTLNFTFNQTIIKAPVIDIIPQTADYNQPLINRCIDIPKQPPRPFC